MKYIPIFFLFIFIACNQNQSEKEAKRSHPSHIYTYSDIDRSELKYYESDYVPVYSDIYHRDGTRRFSLTPTISRLRFKFHKLFD